MPVKILGICGSYRRASTYAALELALNEAGRQPETEIQLLELRGREIQACVGCNRCLRQQINDCLSFQDDMQEIFMAFQQADGYLIATPVYSMGVTPILAAMFSRFRPNFLVSRQDPDCNLFKVGGALAVGGTRNGGQESAIHVIHGFYHTKGITVVNGGLGAYSGGAVWSHDNGRQGTLEDENGTEHAKALGRRVAKAAAAMKCGTREYKG